MDHTQSCWWILPDRFPSWILICHQHHRRDASEILDMIVKDVPKLEASKDRVKHINKVIVM